jgi:catechol 2,3-dioxygenase-like lactoylglutathione lyase family enzyme
MLVSHRHRLKENTSMLQGFHHAAISTPAAADALTGLKDSAARAVLLKLGDSFLEIFEFSSPRPQPGNPDRPACDHGITHICVAVKDCQHEYQRLLAAGMRFHAPPQAQEGGFVCYGRDPDGNIIELLEFS